MKTIAPEVVVLLTNSINALTGNKIFTDERLA